MSDAKSPLPLYRGLTAYALEAVPYDVSELVVVGNLNDARAAAEAAEAAGRGGGGALAAVAARVPQPVWDVSGRGRFGGFGSSYGFVLAGARGRQSL
jgi:hypothetical protein